MSHQKPTGSKQKAIYKSVKNLEHRIEHLDDVGAPEKINKIHFRQNEVLKLYNSYPITGKEIDKRYGDKILFDEASFQI